MRLWSDHMCRRPWHRVRLRCLRHCMRCRHNFWLSWCWSHHFWSCLEGSGWCRYIAAGWRWHITLGWRRRVVLGWWRHIALGRRRHVALARRRHITLSGRRCVTLGRCRCVALICRWWLVAVEHSRLIVRRWNGRGLIILCSWRSRRPHVWLHHHWLHLFAWFPRLCHWMLFESSLPPVLCRAGSDSSSVAITANNSVTSAQ
mmetsp:Transcript_56210/g.111716  ORF Transcript_56210/g.111716 Transcript_56210/m.111716 type:complete len:202 (-) Transcript_56210:1286-1891(-)